jgi:three-Cys-motif partner protein
MLKVFLEENWRSRRVLVSGFEMGEEKLSFNAWPYEAQTKNKHKVFRDYIDKWIKILGKYSGVNYIDCFGGCGAYEEKEGKIYYGSPIIAAQIIEDNIQSLNRKVSLIIIEKDKKNVQNLKKIFNYLDLKIKPEFIEKDFDTAINNILDEYPNIAPTFFFVDPFGFSIKRLTLERIMKTPKSEIFFNFMFNGVNRFLELPQFEPIFDELFGTQDWKSLCSLEGKERESCILKKITENFKSFTKFVYPYRMSFGDKNITYYYLIHLSNHYKGCSIMKSCFAECNLGRTEFSGSGEKQLSLNDIEVVKRKDCNKFLLSYYRNNTKKTFQEICEENICREFNPFLHSHFNHSIQELEKEGKIKINRIPSITKNGKKRTSLKEQDEIIFN